MMQNLSKDSLQEFQKRFNPRISILDVVADTLGGSVTAGGLWRFFGKTSPAPGIAEWNDEPLWKMYWGPSARGLACIGEDLFGNQLVSIDETPDLLIWDHENGSLCTLDMAPDVAIEAVFESGVDWIEFYDNGSPQIGVELLDTIPETSHLHWTTPLILGGKVSASNTSVVERVSHMVGHGKLWQQVQGLPPGAPVVLKPS